MDASDVAIPIIEGAMQGLSVAPHLVQSLLPYCGASLIHRLLL
jgi:hypothetical protein